MMSNRRLPRLLVQLACLLASIVLLLPALPWKTAAKFVIQASPFVAICSSIAVRAVSVGTAIGLAFAAIAIVRPRWFCRYACPIGLLLEGSARIGLNKSSWWTKCPPLGQYAALLTFFGALAGYPLLLWMDPLAIFSSPFTIRTTGDVHSGILACLLLVILILASLLFGLIWCVRICPLGGTQDLLASVKSIFRSRMRTGSAQSPHAFSPDSRMKFARRAFLAVAAGVGLGLWARKAGAARGEDAPLRPPGAVGEQRFAGICIRCSNCVRACPSGIIHPDTGKAGVLGLLAPIIRFEKKYCVEDCNTCTQVCPSGALQSLDLKQKRKYVIGEALVDASICLLTLGVKDCDACMHSCSFDAVRIHWDENQYVAYPIVDSRKCNGCGACEVVCPTERTKAIRVWKLKNDK